MNQIERITHMEKILDEASEAVCALERALDHYTAVRERLAELGPVHIRPNTHLSEIGRASCRERV